MKKKLTVIVLLLLCMNTINLFTQSVNEPEEIGGEYIIGNNDANHPCITIDQYEIIEKNIFENRKLLGINHNMEKNMTSFSWPLQTANGLNDCSYYYIGNYVDQDTSSPGILDWNCGAVTYDGHRGNDICTYPYPFYKMDNNQVQVIAAAAGTIIDKADGNFDKNCTWAGNPPANYIIIQHADGSCALYWHMKMNSVTVKTIGQTVAAGEYLGIVGSSGYSTGPHLHFEVWSSTTPNTLQDAFSGICNSLNASSWWVSQKPYTEPAIIEASVHPILAVFPACPATETPNEDTCFLSGGTAKFYIFVRNQVAATTAYMRIANPDGTTFTSWTKNFVNNYLTAYWLSTQTLPTIAGTYIFEAAYNGDTCSQKFTINCSPAGISELNDDGISFQVYPNPANEKITIAFKSDNNTNIDLLIHNAFGQEIFAQKNADFTETLTLDVSQFIDGVYFISCSSDHEKGFIRKIIIRK